LAPLQSAFKDVCRVSSSLLKFSGKLAINHRQSSNKFFALDKSNKKYIKAEQSRTPTKTRQDVMYSLLCEFHNRRNWKGKKSFKKRKCAASIFNDNDFCQARKLWQLKANDLKEQSKGSKSNAVEAR